MKLRVTPWYTDGCTDFLNNLFKWWPLADARPTALEIGGGNSTLYLLGKGFRVVTIEASRSFGDSIKNIATQAGYNVKTGLAQDEILDKLNQFDLCLLYAEDTIHEASHLFDSCEWDVIVNDGIDRTNVLRQILNANTNSLVILDNCEYCANWGGRLERGSAHTTRIPTYREFLRSPDWHCYLFEQPEGRNGYSAPDCTGWEAPNRWITAAGWHKDHILQELMVTNIGLPLVTPEGINNSDLETLPERCPFDWVEKKWLTEAYTNYFQLKRKQQ